MFFLALSCLQGRPMASALDSLLALKPDGIQLTPGNQPTADFESDTRRLRTRTHHGFTFTHWKRAVWNDDGTCAVQSDSVHPPVEGHASYETWVPREGMPVLETMYPGSRLGTGLELDAVMALRLPLAVDISHVFIQRTAGVIGEATWNRLQDYEHIAEIHVSRNEGRLDSHLPLTKDTFGLAWAKQKLRSGTPVILESYFHRVSEDARRAQCGLFDAERR